MTDLDKLLERIRTRTYWMPSDWDVAAAAIRELQAELERLKDPDGDHHYMKRLLAQERERARIAELCECGEPECIKQQVTEQRLRAERAEAEVERLHADPRLRIPLDGPGSHRLDLVEQRAQRERAERAEARVDELANLGRELAEAVRGADWVLALMKDQIDHEDPDVVAAEAALSVALARAKDLGWL